MLTASWMALRDDEAPGRRVPDQDHPCPPGASPTPWGAMPRLNPVDTDSLAEQIQHALPHTHVVKAFVTQEQETRRQPRRVRPRRPHHVPRQRPPEHQDRGHRNPERLRLERHHRPRPPADGPRTGDVRPLPHRPRPRPRQPLRRQDRAPTTSPPPTPRQEASPTQATSLAAPAVRDVTETIASYKRLGFTGPPAEATEGTGVHTIMKGDASAVHPGVGS